MKKIKWLFVPVVVLGVSVLTGAQAPASINGTTRLVGNQQVLNLWGTPYDMGYAHGYLMAAKIRDLVDTYAIGTMSGGSVSWYNDFLTSQGQYMTFYDQTIDEMTGIADGMTASGRNLYVPSLKRNINLIDVKALNMLVEMSFACSSFGVWGTGTSGGETIIGRNLDFFYDPQGNLLNHQVLITYEPSTGPRFVSFSWPGFVGVASGLNEDGVSVMINMGYGSLDSSAGPFHPSLEVFRRILETTTLSNHSTQPLSVVKAVKEYSTFIVQMGAPSPGLGSPVHYLEDATSQNLIRYGSESDPGYNFVIATNHFLKVNSSSASSDSASRYNRLRSQLINLSSTGDGKVDSTEAWSLLGSVAASDTLFSVVMRPNRMEFDVAFGRMANGSVTVAPALQPQTYTWASLFPNHDPNVPPPVPPPPPPTYPDLAVSSLTVPTLTAACQNISVSDTTKNAGQNVAEPSFTRFRWSRSAAGSSSDVSLGTRTIGTLAAGASSPGKTTVKVPCGIARGTYYVIGAADSDKAVAESNENNNSRARAIFVR